MKKLICVLFVLLLLTGCSRSSLTFDDLYDDLLDDYTNEVELREKAETKYEELVKKYDMLYTEFLFCYFYLLGDEDVSKDRAIEAARTVHDYFDILDPR